MPTVQEFDSIRKTSTLPLDANSMKADGTPYTSVAEAHSSVPGTRIAIGDTRIINSGNGNREFWYQGGTALVNLVKKYPDSGFGETFSDIILKNRQAGWGPSVPTTDTSGESNGGDVDALLKTITITSGTGINTFIARSFQTSTFTSYEIGDTIKIRLLLTENKPVLIGNITAVTLSSGGTNVPLAPEDIVTRPYPEDNLKIEVIISYVLQAANETLAVKLSIVAGNPPQSGNRTITWESLNVLNETQAYVAATNIVDQAVRDIEGLYPFFERSAVVSLADTSTGVDNLARLQDEFEDARQKSGVIILPNGTITVSDTLEINGPLYIMGRENTIINPTTLVANKCVFEVKTADSIQCESFTIHRGTANTSLTSFKFNAANINKDSVFKRVTFSNMTNGLLLDYVDGFVVEDCVFLSGDKGIILGSVAPGSVKNVAIRQSRFEGNTTNGISALAAADLVIAGNIFRAGIGHIARCISIIATGGTSSVPVTYDNTVIRENTFKSFTQHAIRVAAADYSRLTGFEISNNYFRDESTATDCSPINVSGTLITDIYTLNSVLIANNRVRNKNRAVWVTLGANLLVSNNTLVRDGSYAGAQGLYIDQCPNPKSLAGNVISGQVLSDFITV
ncbi:right-handed parallel beta-helix repeat-containing protein [Dyadobacter sp. 22481]|uniref:right-handed parallel beta-helix repeat-containing protein n=1 Tax=Dyadobacter sp. 22481 TaxID=3453926 RepID=UPI003F868692